MCHYFVTWALPNVPHSELGQKYWIELFSLCVCVCGGGGDVCVGGGDEEGGREGKRERSGEWFSVGAS